MDKKEVIKHSLRGIQREINCRTWAIADLMGRLNGSVSRFITPAKKTLPLMTQAIHLHREVKLLRFIRNDLRKQL